ncbi:MAG: carboxypeptidase-like regulatory domain-containing protein [Bacteroidota bacterium]|nr:carboxypeptidase-like regulatory domain-containing protein [Bacteroidota bacterium]
MKRQFILIAFIFLNFNYIFAQIVLIKGIVIDNDTHLPIRGVVIKCLNSPAITESNVKGEFSLQPLKRGNFKISFSHLSYQNIIRDVKSSKGDTIFISISLIQKSNLLNDVSVYALQKPETLVGKPNYSVYDFDFYEDKLLLLTAEKSLSEAKIQLSDYSGKIYSTFELPKGAGEAHSFFHDYEGYTDIICKDSVFRIDVMNNQLFVMPILKEDYKKYLEPIIDTANNNYYVTDKWDKYPMFNYYYLNRDDTLNKLLQSITNEDLMKLYNLEYYYLPSRAKLEARRMAEVYKTDKKIIAALMSGFTQSMYYEPLFAPLFIINDTICIFNHHNDNLYHYNKQNKLIDSVNINYHHPKNWREWRKQLFVDEIENKVYAFFSKNEHHYIKQINYQTGREVLTYKLKHHSAQKIKIKDSYLYYVYRPFDSTQEKFLYREKIIDEK